MNKKSRIINTLMKIASLEVLVGLCLLVYIDTFRLIVTELHYELKGQKIFGIAGFLNSNYFFIMVVGILTLKFLLSLMNHKQLHLNKNLYYMTVAFLFVFYTIVSFAEIVPPRGMSNIGTKELEKNGNVYFHIKNIQKEPKRDNQ